jgi:RNA polymerase sigma factor (sigma-70 family)
MVGDEAPDVVQRVFFKVWLNRERWVVKTTVVAYLFKSVRNRALELRLQDDQRRCNERRYVQHARRTDGPGRGQHEESPDWIAEIDEQLAMVFASGEARAMRGDVERALSNAVAAMSPRCRQVFTMYWEMQSGQALSYREIGLALGMSASTVRQHLIKAARFWTST